MKSNSFAKLAIGIIGFFSAFVAIKQLFPSGIYTDSKLIDSIISTIICIIVFFFFYFVAEFVLKKLPKLVDRLDSYLKGHKYSTYDLMLGLAGVILGLVFANLLCIPINAIPFIGIPITLMINVIFAYLGFSLALKNKNDKVFNRLRVYFEDHNSTINKDKLIDTSVIIDGRIYDILKSGFIDGKIYVADFVIEELGTLSDSDDSIKRSRGRRGLDILKAMQEEYPKVVEVINVSESISDEITGVDDKLICIAGRENYSILTNDLNLNKIASLKGIKVLNINELANALKPVAIVGETIQISIVKPGKEREQGIGYLDSGTMVVVEGAKNLLGETVEAVVTSIIQTQAGRMIFSTLKTD